MRGLYQCDGPSADWLSLARSAFCFWTTLTALHPAIFFFSVYNMGVGGHEALLVIQVLGLAVTLVPALRRRLLQPGQGELVRKSDSTHVGHIRTSTLTTLYALSLSGLSVWMMDDRLVRLLATAASCTAFAVLYALQWGRAWETEQLDRQASSECTWAPVTVNVVLTPHTALRTPQHYLSVCYCRAWQSMRITGELGLSWCRGCRLTRHRRPSSPSNNPAWPLVNSSSGGVNLLALLLALASAVERVVSHQQAGRAKSVPFVSRTHTSSATTAIAASSLGALIFILHILLSDSGSMIAWTWSGYPVQG